MTKGRLTPATIMPIFGKSLFETVLDRLDAEAEEAGEEAKEENMSPGFSPRAAWAGFVGLERDSSEIDADRPNPYDDFAPDPRPKAIPAWLERLSEADVAADLGLDACRGETELRERRRLFALDNHPDRVEEDYRAAANIRMMIANQLVDAALARYLTA